MLGRRLLMGLLGTLPMGGGATSGPEVAKVGVGGALKVAQKVAALPPDLDRKWHEESPQTVSATEGPYILVELHPLKSVKLMPKLAWTKIKQREYDERQKTISAVIANYFKSLGFPMPRRYTHWSERDHEN